MSRYTQLEATRSGSSMPRHRPWAHAASSRPITDSFGPAIGCGPSVVVSAPRELAFVSMDSRCRIA